MVSGLTEAQVLDVSLQKEFSEKVIGKKCLCLERETLNRQTVGSSQKVTEALKFGVFAFYGLGSFMG